MGDYLRAAQQFNMGKLQMRQDQLLTRFDSQIINIRVSDTPLLFVFTAMNSGCVSIIICMISARRRTRRVQVTDAGLEGETTTDCPGQFSCKVRESLMIK